MQEAVLALPPPPPAAHQLLIFLLQVALLLLLARGLGRLAELVKLPAIVGELLTGVVLGPSLLGNLTPGLTEWLLPADPEQMHMLDAVGQLGVLLLVGVTGTHLDQSMLRRRGGTALRISLTGLLITLTFGVLTGFLMPQSLMAGDTERWVFALFLGVAMCVAAIPVIAKILSDMRLLHRDVGQLTIAAGTVDDVVGWTLLSVVSAAATIGVGVRVAWSVVFLFGFVVLAAVVGRPLVVRVMRQAASADTPGPTVARAVVIVLFGAATTSALGMEPVFGAFVAGILLGVRGGTDQTKLAPLRTLVLAVLAPIFMATAGLRMDLTALAQPAVALAAVAVLSIAITLKFTGVYLGARLSRLGHWEGIAIGAGMNARGVIEVIVAMTGLRLGVLNTATYTIIVLVAIVTSLMAPPLLRWTMRRVTQSEEELLRKATHDAWAGHTQNAPAGRQG